MIVLKKTRSSALTLAQPGAMGFWRERNPSANAVACRLLSKGSGNRDEEEVLSALGHLREARKLGKI